MNDDFARQMALCTKFGANYLESPRDQKIGLARNVRDGLMPINGVRHLPTADTTGWYVWAGEDLSDASEFFEPVHVEHLSEWCPAVVKYLGLSPGWRFLIAPGYEDVWFDPGVLQID